MILIRGVYIYICNICNQTCMYMYVFIACDVEGENGWS